MKIDVTVHIHTQSVDSTTILKNLEKIMAAIDDLKAAVDAEDVELGHVKDAVVAEEANVTAIVAELKALNANTDANLTPLVQRLSDHLTNMQAISAGLTTFDPNPAPTDPAV